MESANEALNAPEEKLKFYKRVLRVHPAEERKSQKIINEIRSQGGFESTHDTSRLVFNRLPYCMKFYTVAHFVHYSIGSHISFFYCTQCDYDIYSYMPNENSAIGCLNQDCLLAIFELLSIRDRIVCERGTYLKGL